MACAVAALGLVAAIASVPVESAAQSADDLPITIAFDGSSAATRGRAAHAAREAFTSYVEWLGPPPFNRATLGDDPGATRPAEIHLALPWWPAPAAMDVEAAVAYEVARRWFGEPSPDAQTRALVDGIAWYLQGRVVEHVFDQVFRQPAYRFETTKFFGGVVPWAFPPLLRQRWTAGLAAPDSLVRRQATAVATLERYVGWPALQAALAVVARDAKVQSLTRETIERTLTASLGQELSWFFAPAFDPAQTYDYRLTGVTTAPGGGTCAPACVVTSVTVHRAGTAAFTGASGERAGTFEQGDAMVLRVEFADGRTVETRWDGRDVDKTFTFESAARPVVASLDPSRVLLLDRYALDNTWREKDPSHAAVGRWAAAWMVWLQNAMLTCVAMA